MSILVQLDGVIYDMETSAHKQGLFVLMDRKDFAKGLLTINEAPVMITEYIDSNVHPLMQAPDIQFNEEFGQVVQVIHASALVRLLNEFRNTELTIKVAEIASNRINSLNSICVDMKTFRSALKKERENKN